MRNRRRTAIWSIAVFLSVSYAAGFLVARKRVQIHFTYFEPPGPRTGGVTVYYFAKNPTANAALYYFFYPIHRCIGFRDDCLRDDDKPLHSPVYSSDLYGLDRSLL